MAEPADRATPHMPDNDLDDEPPCWHTEPATPCDWNICRQPERLARGDRGTDPDQQHYRQGGRLVWHLMQRR